MDAAVLLRTQLFSQWCRGGFMSWRWAFHYGDRFGKLILADNKDRAFPSRSKGATAFFWQTRLESEGMEAVWMQAMLRNVPGKLHCETRYYCGRKRPRWRHATPRPFAATAVSACECRDGWNEIAVSRTKPRDDRSGRPRTTRRRFPMRWKQGIPGAQLVENSRLPGHLSRKFRRADFH